MSPSFPCVLLSPSSTFLSNFLSFTFSFFPSFLPALNFYQMTSPVPEIMDISPCYHPFSPCASIFPCSQWEKFGTYRSLVDRAHLVCGTAEQNGALGYLCINITIIIVAVMKGYAFQEMCAPPLQRFIVWPAVKQRRYSPCNAKRNKDTSQFLELRVISVKSFLTLPNCGVDWNI
jgi:hypothetical protein